LLLFKWLDRLGFKYEPRKKSYYVDAHEKPETVAYRRHFIKRYLKYEIRMFRWIQLPLDEVRDMEANDEIEEGLGYRYQCPVTQIEMVEFHVDDHPSFQDRLMPTTQFGGNLSVRKPANVRPLICFGQDECIFKQYTFTPKAWTAPDGTKPMIPKDDGLGVMISAFVSREFGFGFFISVEDLAKVNKARENKQYSDGEAARKVRGNTRKGALTQSPFVVEFEYGTNNQGYWDYDHMVLQFEDCADVASTLHPEYEFIFLFDHSCGHDRQRPDGLSAPKMNKSFGGAQPRMRRSHIETNEYLGRFPARLEVGHYQYMNFQDGDCGPFYLSQADREASKFDCRTGGTVTKKRKKEKLEQDLAAIGVVAKGTRDQLAKVCEQNNLPVQDTTEIIKDGWVGKPKGMLQVLWERGYIDPSIQPTKAQEYYTNDGKKDAFGNLIEGSSLRKMMKELLDFIEEETLLQYHGKLLGVTVDRTPKCHPEMAGEGVEYSWGCAKGLYRWLSIAEKKKKEKFRDSVRKCLDPDVLSVERQRMFSRRAREYMLAYHSIEREREKSKSEVVVDESKKNAQEKAEPQMSAYLVEKAIERFKAKKYKSHRDVADIDSAYINRIVREMKREKWSET
jgi:hypothetical protein